MRFKKKPVVIEAIQWTGINREEIEAFVGDHARWQTFPESADTLLSIWTLEGLMAARVGDWIIKGVNGEFYPCKPDIFAQTYDAEV